MRSRFRYRAMGLGTLGIAFSVLAACSGADELPEPDGEQIENTAPTLRADVGGPEATSIVARLGQADALLTDRMTAVPEVLLRKHQRLLLPERRGSAPAMVLDFELGG